MIAALGLLLGIVLGLLLQPDVPAGLSPTCPIAVVAALDAVFGGLRAFLDGIFDDKVFVVSFLSNVVIAAAIVYLGDKLGRRRPAVDRRDRGARHPDLLQRRRDPAAPLPCLTRRPPEPDDEPGPPDRPGRAAHRLRPRSARRPARSRSWSPCCSRCSGFAAVAQVRANERRRQLRRPARAGPDRRAQRADRRHRSGRRARSPGSSRPARDLQSDTQRRGPRPWRRPSSRLDTLGILAGTCRSPGRASGHDHRARRTGRRRLDARHRRRSCGPPAPRRWRSTTRSGWSRRRSFADGVGGIVRRRARCSTSPYVIDAIGDPHTLRRRRWSSPQGPSTSCEDDGADGRRSSELDVARRSTSVRERRPRPEYAEPDTDAVACPRTQHRRRRPPDDRGDHRVPRRPEVHRRARVGAHPRRRRGSVRVGITHFAQDALGDIVYVSPARGRRRRRRPATPAASSSRPSRSATSTRRSPARSSPATSALDATPELVNTDPYGGGWLFEVAPHRRRRRSTACWTPRPTRRRSTADVRR